MTDLSRAELNGLASGLYKPADATATMATMARALLAVMEAKPFGYAHTYDPFAMMASLHKEETRHHSLKLYTTPPAPSATDCEWTFDESQYSWHSACGEDYLFTDGGPVENRVRFCQGCGGKVKIPAAQGGDE